MEIDKRLFIVLLGLLFVIGFSLGLGIMELNTDVIRLETMNKVCAEITDEEYPLYVEIKEGVSSDIVCSEKKIIPIQPRQIKLFEEGE